MGHFKLGAILITFMVMLGVVLFQQQAHNVDRNVYTKANRELSNTNMELTTQVQSQYKQIEDLKARVGECESIVTDVNQLSREMIGLGRVLQNKTNEYSKNYLNTSTVDSSN